MTTAVRVHLDYEVFEDDKSPGEWIVSAADDYSEGEMYVAIFTGFNAEARAREYATWKNGRDVTSPGGLDR